jgi:hypothetical protein
MVLCAAVTKIGVVPDLVESCVDVALIVAVPAVAEVKTPVVLTVPMLVGLTDQVTEGLKLPVPLTVGTQVDVWFVYSEVGEQFTATDVIVEVAGGVPPPELPPPHATSAKHRTMRNEQNGKERGFRRERMSRHFLICRTY